MSSQAADDVVFELEEGRNSTVLSGWIHCIREGSAIRSVRDSAIRN